MVRRFYETTGKPVLRYARRAVVAIVGATVLLLGVVMLVAPGPAFLVIPSGVAILAIEFAWARRLLKGIREEGPRGLWKRLLRVYRPPWRRESADSDQASPPDQRSISNQSDSPK